MFHVTHVQCERVETHRRFYVNMFINKLQGRGPSWSHKQGIEEEGLNHRLPCFQNKAKQNKKKPFLYFI